MAIKDSRGVVCKVVRLGCQYMYRLNETGTLNRSVVNREQLINMVKRNYGLKGHVFAPTTITKSVTIEVQA